jgi:heat shock protein HslJ
MVLAACGDDTTSSDPADTAAGQTTAGADALTDTRWTLDVAGLDVPGAEKVLPTIAFADGSVSGSAGCNTFNGSYTLSGDTLTLGQLATTNMACGPVESAVEKIVLDRLGKVATYQATADSLTLSDSSGATLLTFAPAPAGVEGAWVATGYLNADKAAFVSIILDSEVTALFGADGTVSGTSGCNTYSGGYTIDGDTLAISQLINTQMACDSPEGVMDQESVYLAALQSSVTFQNDGATLTLLDAEGRRTVTYTAAAG